MSLRKMAVLALGILGLASLIGGGPQPAAAAGAKRVAYLNTSMKNPFTAAIAASMVKRAKENGYEVTTFDAAFDAARQAQQVNDALAQKYDVIAITPVSSRGIIPSLAHVKAAGVPVVLVNSPIDPGHDDLYLAFVGENQAELGRSTALSLLKGAGGRKSLKTAIIAGTLQESASHVRLGGFEQAVKKDPRVKIVAVEDGKWNMAVSEQIAGQLFARFAAQGGLDAIFAMSDQMAQGVIQAARGADIPLGQTDGRLLIVTSDCLRFGMDNIAAGLQYSDETVMPTRTGRAAADIIAAYFDGKKVEQQNYLPVQPITKANLDQFRAACTF